MAPGLSPVERGAAKVASAEAAKLRIAQDIKNARVGAKQLPNGELRRDGQLFARHSCVVSDSDWDAALASQNFFGKYVNRLRRLDEITLWAQSGTKRDASGCEDANKSWAHET